MENEQEVTPEVVVPSLTTDQKLSVREAQVRSMKMREQARGLNDQSAALEQQIAKFINDSAAQLKVDNKLFGFDIESLSFYKLPSQ